jgi:puromycin-sensitive aminopeptidase
MSTMYNSQVSLVLSPHSYLSFINDPFFQYLCIDHIYPEFQVFNYFCTETFVPAMGMDALANSHPVNPVYFTTTFKFHKFSGLTSS